MWERRNEIDFPTNLEYMMEHIDRFAQEDFVPTNTDVLYARQRTTGVVETTFHVRSIFGDSSPALLPFAYCLRFPPNSTLLTHFSITTRSTPSLTGHSSM